MGCHCLANSGFTEANDFSLGINFGTFKYKKFRGLNTFMARKELTHYTVSFRRVISARFSSRLDQAKKADSLYSMRFIELINLIGLDF